MTFTKRIALASVVGTTIEFYDFYVFATAAALVFGPLFFPSSAPGSQQLNAYLAFGIAFFARPFGAFLFGHFGDRIGRKSTLVASLLVMGISTTLIGLLPTFAMAGWLAPVLLCVLRMGQGIGLGGEWGGAALLATENAPDGQRGWFGMFPQLGPPFGFIMANGLFLILTAFLSPVQFANWGWRVPFLVSAVLVVLGLYARVTLTETKAFARMQSSHAHSGAPLLDVLRHHMKPLLLGSLAVVVCYTLFYICTVFAISYLTAIRGLPRRDVLELLCLAIFGMAAATPMAGWLADRFGRRKVLISAATLTIGIGFLLPMALDARHPATLLAFLFVALWVMGMTFSPVGALLPEMFPTRVRYTGASMAYNIASILGGSLTPYFAQVLQAKGGLAWVGYYLAASAVVSFLSLLMIKESADRDLTAL